MTNAELAILSLVAEQPMHGYQIEQVIEQRGMREWTEIGFSSIYYLLKKLDGKKLVEGQLEETERGPARKVYHITQAGECALHNAMIEALSEPQRQYSNFPLGLGNLPVVSPKEALMALNQYQDKLVSRLENLQASWKKQQPLPYFVDALFNYSKTMMSAELLWVEKFIGQMEAYHEQD